MKTILLALALALISTTTIAQDKNGIRGYSIPSLEGGKPFVHLYSAPQDTAKDSVVYIKKFQYDLGGAGYVIYGINIYAFADTFSLNLALDASINDTTWVAVDSVAVTTGTTGRYTKKIDLAAFTPYPFWRERISTATTQLRGNTATAGRFDFFVLTKFRP